MVSLGKDIVDRIDVGKLIWREESLTVIVSRDLESSLYEIRNSISESILDNLETPVGFNIFMNDPTSNLCAVRISDEQSTIDGYASLYTGIINLEPEKTKSVYTKLDNINQNETYYSEKIAVISICQDVIDQDVSQFNLSFNKSKVNEFISKNL